MGRHVPHLLVPGPWDGGTLALTTEQQAHLAKVLRRAAGEPLSYTDGAGRIGEGTFDGVALVRGEEHDTVREPTPLFAVAPPQERDRQRFLVEKLVELRIAGLVWLRTVNGEGRPPSPPRSRAWATSALEQSRSAWELEISPEMVTIDELPPGTVFADQAGDRGALPPDTPCVAVGPPGGWGPDEVPVGAFRHSLGPGVLRTETAALALAAEVHGAGGFTRPL